MRTQRASQGACARAHECTRAMRGAMRGAMRSWPSLCALIYTSTHLFFFFYSRPRAAGFAAYAHHSHLLDDCAEACALPRLNEERNADATAEDLAWGRSA